jgi:hypothetical protein
VSQAAATAEPRGPVVEDLDSETFRQIPSGFLHEGRVARCAFEVKERDKGLLSIALSTKTTAEAAYTHHTGTLGLKSVAVYAVKVGQCEGEGLKVWEDPETDPPPNPAHGVIDFRGCLADKAGKKRREYRLAQIATERGPVYTPR